MKDTAKLESQQPDEITHDLEAEDFLELIWGEREGWIDLPARVGQYWIPFHLEWRGEATNTVSRRIDSCLRDREDLYYSVTQFSQRGRSIEDVMPSHWLWADLDQVHPSAATAFGFMPTVAVESSPGRYQALWRLDRELSPKNLVRLNQGLTYALDADRGGWDLTQVLRIPGTRNFKYPEAPIVRLMWYKEENVYDPRAIWGVVKTIIPPEAVGGAPIHVPRTKIPTKAKTLLRTPLANVVEGERSARLWELECLLAESGLTDDEIFSLLWDCAWNKWRGTGDSGRRRLRGDIRKALGYVKRKAALAVSEGEDDGRQRARPGRPDEGNSQSGRLASGDDTRADSGVSSGEATISLPDASGDRGAEVSSDMLPWIGYSSFMAMVMEEPKWLIEDIWTAGSHGIIGGEPKTSKTTVALALALSVASGCPFLGRHAVGTQGPVLMVQEENAPWMMQDRLRKLAAHAGLISTTAAHFRTVGAGGLGNMAVDLDFPMDLPFRLLNNYGFDLAVEEHRDMLEAEVQSFAPRLLILDPLYLILSGNLNEADSLRPFLKWLLWLRYEYNCAVAVVHHTGKDTKGLMASSGARPGQRLLGSTTLHGWCDSALYLSRVVDDRPGWVHMMMETEFRSMAPAQGIDLALALGPPGGLSMEVEIGRHDIEAVIREMVTESPGVTVTRVAERLGVDKRTVLSRIRGSDGGGIVIRSVTRGRGKSSMLYLEADAPPLASESSFNGKSKGE